MDKKTTVEPMIDVSVIVVNYNTRRMTAECINSIFEMTKDIGFEVLLVDNASTDGSKDFFEKDTRIRYVYSFKNLGFGRANNLGMLLSEGKYIFLLNSDTLLINNAIKAFYDYAEETNPMAFYGCWLQDTEGIFIHSCAKTPTIKLLLQNVVAIYKSKLNIKIGDGANISYNRDKCIEVGYITGADLFLHRRLFEQTGGFDDEFFMYYEESDWQRRAKQIGYYSYCINGPQIVHLVGGSQRNRGLNVFKEYIKFKSSYYYVYKHYGMFKYVCYRAALIILYIPLYCFAPRLTFHDRLKAISLLFGSYISLLTKKH